MNNVFDEDRDGVVRVIPTPEDNYDRRYDRKNRWFLTAESPFSYDNESTSEKTTGGVRTTRIGLKWNGYKYFSILLSGSYTDGLDTYSLSNEELLGESNYSSMVDSIDYPVTVENDTYNLNSFGTNSESSVDIVIRGGSIRIDDYLVTAVGWFGSGYVSFVIQKADLTNPFDPVGGVAVMNYSTTFTDRGKDYDIFTYANITGAYSGSFSYTHTIEQWQ